MSHSIPSYGLRTLALVAALAAARLVTPAATQAQSITPEQALLNRTAVAVSEAVKTDAVPVDGERALLGRWPSGAAEPRVADNLGDVAPVDGERALLGSVARSETRRVVLGL